jgi:hypothetical protein
MNVEATLGVPNGPAPEDANGGAKGDEGAKEEDGHFLTPFLSSIKIPGM